MSAEQDKKVRWEEMFPEELYRKIQDESVCYLVYGLAEPHGPYNALGLDWIKAYKLAELAARTHGGVVAPPFAWHMQERPEFHDDGKGHGWLPSVGVKQSLCSSIPSDLFYRMVFHQIRDVDARGFHAAILITGHYGGLERTLRLMCEYYGRRTGSPLRLAAIADWEAINYKDYSGDHAGRCETSQLMALAPEMVDLSRRTVPPELGTSYATGVNFDDEDALPSREEGLKIVESQVEQLGRMARELLEAYEPAPDWQAPSQRDVEDVWHRFEQTTWPYWNATFSEYREALEGKGRKFPGWEALGE
ncbi:MAG: creatininase family protein [Planctomycetes bacterium]|nr:creatininase family protein [Planctomycetota bacterium]